MVWRASESGFYSFLHGLWIYPYALQTWTARSFQCFLEAGKSVLQNLSDVLEAMQDIGFQIDVVTLDSATKGLPKNDRRWLQREEEFVKKLMSKGIAVWKKMGLHAKMYLFPHGALTGSVNLTRQGFFANAENITHCIIDDREEYESVVINADAQLRGSIHYFDRSGPP